MQSYPTNRQTITTCVSDEQPKHILEAEKSKPKPADSGEGYTPSSRDTGPQPPTYFRRRVKVGLEGNDMNEFCVHDRHLETICILTIMSRSKEVFRLRE